MGLSKLVIITVVTLLITPITKSNGPLSRLQARQMLRLWR